MPRGLIEAYERDFGVNVVHAWGMTEMSPIGSVAKLQTQHQDLDDGGPLGYQSQARLLRARRRCADR